MPRATSTRHGWLKPALQVAFLTTGPVNHEYEEDADRLTKFFTEMVKATPALFERYQRLLDFWTKA